MPGGIKKKKGTPNELCEEIAYCSCVNGVMREMLLTFLVERGVRSIEDITDKDKEELQRYLCVRKGFSISKSHYYALGIEMFQYAYFCAVYPEVVKELMMGIKNDAKGRKAVTFLISHGVRQAAQIDYEIRVAYKEYLKHNIASSKQNEYMKALDNIKLYAIRKETEKFPLKRRTLSRKDKKVFLLYHPDYEIGRTFYFVRDKEELFFDFSLEGAEKMKEQILRMLNHVLESRKNWHDRRERFLIPLRILYACCIEMGVEDIELLEEEHIARFMEMAEALGNTKQETYYQIIENIRKFLFVTSDQINWNANAWYMERFSIADARENPARQIRRFIFTRVRHAENRKLFKEYMRYAISLSYLSISTIRSRFGFVEEFLRYCDRTQMSILEVDASDVERFLKELDDAGHQAATYNVKLISIQSLYTFLISKGYVKRYPVIFEYYLKKFYPEHKDRCVREGEAEVILKALSNCPHELRLMYLHLWALGLRISEVCSIKAGGYFERNGETWLRLYQNKMQTEKVIPIPRKLYELMKSYIMEAQKRPGAYVFQRKNGEAYDAGTFSKQMKAFCAELNYEGKTIAFRAHDYRHNVATDMESEGIALQVIRDYLGHKTQEMTKAYLDYLPNKIHVLNEEYFMNHQWDEEYFMNHQKSEEANDADRY